MTKKEATEEMITIPKRLYERLKNDSTFLEALKIAGVDNWEGHEYAYEIYDDIKGEGGE